MIDILPYLAITAVYVVTGVFTFIASIICIAVILSPLILIVYYIMLPYFYKKPLIQRLLTENARLALELFDRPYTEWYFDEYNLIHRPSKIGFWIRSGSEHMNMYCKTANNHVLGGELVYVSVIDRRVLWSAYKKIFRDTRSHGRDFYEDWKINSLLDKIKNSD